MEILQETKDFGKKSFFNQVINMSEEGNAEIMNVSQYAILAIIPVVILNKLVQRFVPEADPDSSSLELLVEVFLQVIIMFVGIVLIHRIIVYIPTYSGFKYESLNLTNVVLAFLVVVLSIQTKLGIKVNILYDRVLDLWNGTSDERKKSVKNKVRVSDSQMNHTTSQADYLDDGAFQQGMFPPAPVATARPQNGSYDHMMRGSAQPQMAAPQPMAANSVLGGGFGAFF
jgi:hypothetical protein